MSESFTTVLLLKHFVQDHLYTAVALISGTGISVAERYEYDAYGNCRIMDRWYIPRSSSNYGNPYLFTGRRVDILDEGSLKLQYNRNRYYDQYTGRWFTHDPLRYLDGMNLYQYVGDMPSIALDAYGLVRSDINPVGIKAWFWLFKDSGLSIAEIMVELEALGFRSEMIIALLIALGEPIPSPDFKPLPIDAKPIDIAPPTKFPISKWKCPPPGKKRYKCCDTVYMFLKALVKSSCKTPGVKMHCSPGDNDLLLFQKMTRHTGCLGARLLMMNICFTPADPKWKEHADAAISSSKGITRCALFLGRKHKHRFRIR